MKNIFAILITLGCLALQSCTEQYMLQSTTFENALVVEATVTNEMKPQKIKITRTYRFEDSGPKFESGAQVWVSDDAGNTYNFEQAQDSYISTVPFQAVTERRYDLHIITSDGKSYNSSPEALTPVNEIGNVVASVKTLEGIRGVAINVTTDDPTGNSKYYRYDYEETYKIVAPRWLNLVAIRVPAQSGEPHDAIEIIDRDLSIETKTCYKTDLSDDILQASNTGASQTAIDYRMRFISDQNPIISHRYSILVKQYVQSLPAYTFYKTLKELSGSQTILSQNQPGFLSGNLRSVENPDEKVIGYFEVASVSSKRIFFNYADLFPNETMPPYFVNCDLQSLIFCFDITDPECKGDFLLNSIANQSLFYFSEQGGLFYLMVNAPCGDCTRIGSNLKPGFWID